MLELVANEDIICVISMYGLRCGRSQQQKSTFYYDLNAVVRA